MPTSYVLLPSALVGAATWDPVAEVLRAHGAHAVVASTVGCSTPAQVLATYLSAVPAPEPGSDLVLVPHSNAGYFAPTVAARTPSAAVVYVDAALPAAGGPTPLAPPALRDFLAGLADDDGLLPPWTRWWDSTPGLFPDDATRERVESGVPRLPLAYFEETVQPPTGWAAGPCAYLAFGDTYAEELARAETHGWPTRRMPGGHLHLLHDPDGCAAAVRGLASRLLDD